MPLALSELVIMINMAGGLCVVLRSCDVLRYYPPPYVIIMEIPSGGRGGRSALRRFLVAAAGLGALFSYLNVLPGIGAPKATTTVFAASWAGWGAPVAKGMLGVQALVPHDWGSGAFTSLPQDALIASLLAHSGAAKCALAIGLRQWLPPMMGDNSPF